MATAYDRIEAIRAWSTQGGDSNDDARAKDVARYLLTALDERTAALAEAEKRAEVEKARRLATLDERNKFFDERDHLRRRIHKVVLLLVPRNTPITEAEACDRFDIDVADCVEALDHRNDRLSADLERTMRDLSEARALLAKAEAEHASAIRCWNECLKERDALAKTVGEIVEKAIGYCTNALAAEGRCFDETAPPGYFSRSDMRRALAAEEKGRKA